VLGIECKVEKEWLRLVLRDEAHRALAKGIREISLHGHGLPAFKDLRDALLTCLRKTPTAAA
jgi:hypothetical protein